MKYLCRYLIVTLATCFLYTTEANAQRYSVIDNVDPMTDERNLNFGYEVNTGGLGTYGMAFACVEGKPFFMAFSGIIFNMDGYIDLMLRFDKNTAEKYSATWLSDSNTAFLRDGNVFLDKALEADTFLVKVGKESVMSFDMIAAREKLSEFKSLCLNW